MLAWCTSLLRCSFLFSGVTVLSMEAWLIPGRMINHNQLIYYCYFASQLNLQSSLYPHLQPQPSCAQSHACLLVGVW